LGCDVQVKKGKERNMRTTIVAKFDGIGFVTWKEVESQEKEVPSDRFLYIRCIHIYIPYSI
jgi:hypothetical protein